MGQFINAIKTQGPWIPEELVDKLQIRALVPLNESELKLFGLALYGVVQQINEDGLSYDDLYTATVICTEHGEFTYSAVDSIASYVRIIVYNVHSWREANWGENHILAAFVEELCHHYWNISDEELVKNKVINVLNHIFNEEIKFGDIYSKRWKEAYPEIYGNKE